MKYNADDEPAVADETTGPANSSIPARNEEVAGNFSWAIILRQRRAAEAPSATVVVFFILIGQIDNIGAA